MSTIERIHRDRRAERAPHKARHLLSEGRDPALAEELKQVEARLAELWVLAGWSARLRFGERDEIVRRARAEERLDRAA